MHKHLVGCSFESVRSPHRMICINIYYAKVPSCHEPGYLPAPSSWGVSNWEKPGNQEWQVGTNLVGIPGIYKCNYRTATGDYEKEKQLAFCAVSRHKFIAIYFLTSTSKRFRPETVAFPATSDGSFLLNAEKKNQPQKGYGKANFPLESRQTSTRKKKLFPLTAENKSISCVPSHLHI